MYQFHIVRCTALPHLQMSPHFHLNNGSGCMKYVEISEFKVFNRAKVSFNFNISVSRPANVNSEDLKTTKCSVIPGGQVIVK